MDKERVQIFLGIIIAVMFFGRAIYDYIKKKRTETINRRIRPAAVRRQSKTDPFMDFDRKTPEPVTKKPIETPVESHHPDAALRHDSSPERDTSSDQPTSDDIRRAVIWSEILNRKYN